MSPDRIQERRKFPRVKSALALELRYAGCTAPVRATTSEISLGGCYIETMFTLDVGTKLDLVMWLDGQKLSAKGIIATRYPQVGNGIDITDMKAEDRARLEAFLKTQTVQLPKRF
jgi:c-di-GMP-binding flagellar brake protein YcgR